MTFCAISVLLTTWAVAYGKFSLEILVTMECHQPEHLKSTVGKPKVYEDNTSNLLDWIE